MLTRLSSICVLEYLSFEKRQYIVSQIPGFRKVEKSLPLNLDTLNIAFDRIRIDQYEYYFSNEISQDSGTSEFRKRQIPYPTIDLSGLVSPSYENVQVALEKLVYDLIGDRSMIYTKKLEFWDSWIFRIPFDLKIRADTVEAGWFRFRLTDLDQLSNFLGPTPLKEFSIRLNNYEILNHSIVQNSQKLVVWRGLADFDPRRISHRHIHLKDYDRQTLYRHMNEWIANGPKIGMELTGDIRNTCSWQLIEDEVWIKKRMYSKKYKYDGKRVKPDKRFPNTLYSMSTPRTNDTELQMSLIKNESIDFQFQMHLKIQPSGTAIPERFDSMYWELKSWETRKMCQTVECQCIFGVILFALIYVLILVSIISFSMWFDSPSVKLNV
ncbi:unnamed protein product [Caenorhabditis nigoni]